MYFYFNSIRKFFKGNGIYPVNYIFTTNKKIKLYTLNVVKYRKFEIFLKAHLENV